ncbi:endoplasmic reticulum mannosyl-oligosaccharide 1,2-alpha-mannosidase isoform X1 [Octopus bimaculoides]|uniref:alpha-1,2-Mannosidase n=2 Tax=Octopus bimaculoides TaxID=37653 RepID=A0A0L8I3B4_OCTBM|nr:endoplasmic reticulum mannosyl-oligosaccharide 1,2-alpha-mannosidase isoform X1 [Octopus bimaculoides]|eukprot:XP_014791191.1 PREDICTED: endoplasmic reticulum mannosyl-oligosaccharide 1,2-alpha-mannosidase-like isoform X1 [Octopus bimaculoides]
MSSAYVKENFAVDINYDSSYDNNKARRKQSLWRMWKRLSQMQRSVIVLVLLLGVLSALYIIPVIQLERTKNKEMNELLKKKQSFFQSQSKMLRSKLLNELEEQNKAKQQVNEIQRAQQQMPIQRGGEQIVLQPPEVPLKFDSHQEKQIHRPAEGKRIPEAAFRLPKSKSKRQISVINAFSHAWKAYQEYAWGHDELRPVAKTYHDWFGVGLTMVDALDTMFIMGLNEEFKEARSWVEKHMILDINQDVNLFEITIRILGGLLSAYHLSGDEVFKQKAKELGDRLMPCFDSPSKIPYSDVNLKTKKAHPPRWGPDSTTSEVTTIQLEFRDLSRILNDPKYEVAASEVSNHIHRQPKKDGLVPIFINAQTGIFRNTATITLGARGDSYYEYLLKQWLQTGKINNTFKDDYLEAVKGMQLHLMKMSEPSKLVYLGELLGGRHFSPKMDHLLCYLPGTLALGYMHGLGDDHLELAKKLMKTCFYMYNRMPTKLSPEIVYFNMAPGAKEDLIVKAVDAHNLHRPETVESLFYLYQITKDKKYQEWGWMIFQAFEKYTKLPNAGYSAINNVKSITNPGFTDKMESFFLAETLKYFYLLFAEGDAIIPLDKYVFNSEAHPLPIYNS